MLSNNQADAFKRFHKAFTISHQQLDKIIFSVYIFVFIVPIQSIALQQTKELSEQNNYVKKKFFSLWCFLLLLFLYVTTKSDSILLHIHITVYLLI